jgi:CBS-domain-containing membrane protein
VAREDHRINALMVCDAAGKLAGVVHVHDLWRLEWF